MGAPEKMLRILTSPANADTLDVFELSPEAAAKDPTAVAAAIAEARRSASWVWVELEGTDPELMVAIGLELGIDDLGIEDVLDVIHYPKVEEFGDHLMLVLHGLGRSAEDDRITTSELDCFIGEDWFLTAHADPSRSIDWLYSAAQSERLYLRSPAEGLARLAEVVARRYLPITAALFERIDEIGDRALEADVTVLADIAALRREEATARRALRPQRSAVGELELMTSPLIDTLAQRRFASAHALHDQTVEAMAAANAMLANTLDIYRGAAAEATAKATTVLTVYAAVLLPLSLIAGIFGMNHDNLPGVHADIGVWLVFVLMAAMAVGSWVMFVRIGLVSGSFLHRAPRRLGRGLASVVALPVRTVGLRFGRSGRFGHPADDQDAI